MFGGRHLRVGGPMEASDTNLDRPAPYLTPAPRVTDSSAVEDAVLLVGFLGEGCSERSRRLYENLGLDRWIEIPIEKIVKRERSPTSAQPLICVRRDATVASCESVRASSYEQPPCCPPDGRPPPAPSAWP